MPANLSTAILPRDFVHSTVADEWIKNYFSCGTLRHIVAVLDSKKALFVIDGLTYEGRAFAIRKTPGYGTYQVGIEQVLSDGTTQRTFFSTFKFQVIIPLEDELGLRPTKWVVTDTIRLEERAALDLAVARHPKITDGKLTTLVSASFVSVRWVPKDGYSFDGWYETFSLTELAAAAVSA